MISMIDNNFKWCREELEMTQEELGKVLKVSRKTISGWETARDPIPLNKLIMFCNLYKYSIDFVLGVIRENTIYNKPINNDKVEIGKRLKEIRKSLNLSQEKFANKCGLSQTTYSHYEIGQNLITTTNIFAISKTYNISIEYILGRSKKKTFK